MVTTRPPKTMVKPTALGPVANTDTKLLIYGLFQKGRVLAQDGVIEAAETDLKTSISSRREYLVEKYGPDPAAAFMNADPLDLPRLADEVRHETLASMERLLKAERKRASEAIAAVRISEKDQQELARLRAIQKEKRRKAQGKRRAAQSKAGKKRKRRKKKR